LKAGWLAVERARKLKVDVEANGTTLCMKSEALFVEVMGFEIPLLVDEAMSMMYYVGACRKRLGFETQPAAKSCSLRR